MRSDLSVVSSPAFDQHLSLKERGEEFHVEKLVPELPVEQFTEDGLSRIKWPEEGKITGTRDTNRDTDEKKRGHTKWLTS
jgi:hypothetical protein